MADEYAQNLPDIPERTGTADTDLMLVNSGGKDFKQTKKNFTFDLVQYHEFNNTESLTSQCDYLALSVKSPAYYVGKINSYGHQSATGVPFNNSYHVQLSIYSGSYIELTLTDVDDGDVFRKIKSGGTWQSSWTMQPTRAEITSLNNSLTNSLFVDTYNKTSYSFPVSPPSGSFGYFLLFGGTTSADTSNVFLFVGMVVNSNVQFVRLCGTQNFTGTISNGVCTITSSNTIWGGIRVISIN